MTLQSILISVVPDLLALVIIILFLVLGWKKGLVRSLGRFFSLLVALFAGKQTADWGAGYLGSLLAGRLEPFVADKLSAIAAQAAVGEDSSLGVLRVIPNAKGILEGISEKVVDSLTPVVALELGRVIGWVIRFLVGFVIVYLLLRLLVAALNAISALPGLHLLNCLGGGFLGAVKGVLIVWVILAVLDLFGILPQQLTQQTHLLRFVSGSA